MVAKIISSCLYGVDAIRVDVETDIRNGLPSMLIVGLPDSAVRESKERIYTSLLNSGYQVPSKKITVNLAPADIKKIGSLYDFPIATSILSSLEIIPYNFIKDAFLAGELSLDGTLKPVSGLLPMLLAAKQDGVNTCYIPYENQKEASLIQDMTIYPVKNISDFVEHCKNPCLEPAKPYWENVKKSKPILQEDFSDVKGQESVKHILLLAASGMHNIIMVGNPGTGKTMMAKRFTGILPDLSFKDSIEITKIYSASAKLSHDEPLISTRPFRNPHHTATQIGLTGGTAIPSPGEITLAHKGVLFLDEIAEFSKSILDTLRQPLEDKTITISRASGAVTYPADFILVGTMNPCPCGYLGSTKCTCSESQISKYTKRLSGPLLDRIDIIVDTPPVEFDDLDYRTKSLSTAELKEKVLQATQRQEFRYREEDYSFNSQLKASHLEKHCKLGKEESAFAKKVYEEKSFTIRSFHKFLKLSRTIADLDDCENIEIRHLGTAVHLRNPLL